MLQFWDLFFKHLASDSLFKYFSPKMLQSARIDMSESKHTLWIWSFSIILAWIIQLVWIRNSQRKQSFIFYYITSSVFPLVLLIGKERLWSRMTLGLHLASYLPRQGCLWKIRSHACQYPFSTLPTLSNGKAKWADTSWHQRRRNLSFQMSELERRAIKFLAQEFSTLLGPGIKLPHKC